jgi:hypothetical protein
MGKYSKRQTSNAKDRPSKLYPKIHPVWRGVGFALMIIAPLMAYATTELLLMDNTTSKWIPIPPNLIVQWQDPLILVKLLATLFLTIVFLAVLQMLFFIIMRIFGPSRYGPLDVPPTTYKGKAYKR